MKTLYLLLLPLLITACDKTTDCCTVVDTGIAIAYTNAEGENWLKQQELTEENIQVYYLNHGQKEKMYRGNLDKPKMFSIYPDNSGKEILGLSPSDYIENSKSRTLIEFSDTEVDTVDCLFDTKGNNTICTEVWYNGESAWTTNQGQRQIQIIKE
ncbi:hypothetical protein ACFSKU_06390 [Pontibacter silvestris]|uniref:Lipoprotein n=1 Tax=Pontibacter silvestris TaxID=2305183 RepID=A0ABW4WVR2_9BACT|nr:hypothetical protein [Pontibacter silvestris]MCC9136463.1 hypothetical protein [Pontibacter silvestris]